MQRPGLTNLILATLYIMTSLPVVVQSSGQYRHICIAEDGRNVTCPTPPPPQQPPEPPEKQARYWLVPPFLIGASSVVIVYVVVNCFYIHCYAKKKLRCLVTQPQGGIMIGELPSSPTPITPLTPIVHFDGGYGRTELISTPFFLSEAHLEMSDIYDDEETPESVHSSLLRPPEMDEKARRSVCSASAIMTGARDGSEKPKERRYTRPSICYVPLTRAISDPTAGMPNSRSSSSNIMFSPMLMPHPGGDKDGDSGSPYQSSRYLLVPPVTYGGQTSRRASIVSMVPLIVQQGDQGDDGDGEEHSQHRAPGVQRQESTTSTTSAGVQRQESTTSTTTLPRDESVDHEEPPKQADSAQAPPRRRQSVVEAGGQQYLLVPAGTMFCTSSRRSSLVGMLPMVFPERPDGSTPKPEPPGTPPMQN